MIAVYDNQDMYFIRKAEEDAQFYVPFAYMQDMHKWVKESNPGDMLIIEELTFIKLSEQAEEAYFSEKEV